MSHVVEHEVLLFVICLHDQVVLLLRQVNALVGLGLGLFRFEADHNFDLFLAVESIRSTVHLSDV